jgi:hypothetical protein
MHRHHDELSFTFDGGLGVSFGGQGCRPWNAEARESARVVCERERDCGFHSDIGLAAERFRHRRQSGGTSCH